MTFTWSDDRAAGAWIEVRDAAGVVVGRRDGVAGDDAVRARFAGLPPGAALTWALRDDSGQLAEGDLAVGARPASVPVPAPAQDGAPLEGVLTTTLLSQPLHAAVLDGAGQPVWWHAEAAEAAISSRVWPTPQGLWYGVFRADVDAPSSFTGLVEVGWTGTEVRRVDLPGYHHDFGRLEDGTLFALTEDRTVLEGLDIERDRLVEIDEGGEVREVWRAEDALSAEDLFAGGDGAHANAVTWVPEHDAWLIGFRNLDTALLVRRDDGAVIARIGGPASTITAPAEGWFEHQHQLTWDAGRLWVFDNRAEPGSVSRVVAYDLDLQARTATEAWSADSADDLFVWGLGGFAPTGAGQRAVAWSTAGQLDVLDADGVRVGQFNTPVGVAIGYLTWRPDLSDVDPWAP